MSQANGSVRTERTGGLAFAVGAVTTDAVVAAGAVSDPSAAAERSAVSLEPPESQGAQGAGEPRRVITMLIDEMSAMKLRCRCISRRKRFGSDKLRI
jgi:hypothetical protein